MAKEQVAAENAAESERQHIEAVLTLVRFVNQHDELRAVAEVPSGLNVADIRDELQRIRSKYPEETTEEVRHRLRSWAIGQLTVNSPARAVLADRMQTSLSLHVQRLADVQAIEEHFKLEDNVEAELMAVRIAAFFVDALNRGQKIVLRGKDGKESEVVFETESDSDERESSAHG